MTRIAILILALLLPSVALAHPEHASGGDFGLVHLLTDPFHVALTAGAALAFLAIRKRVLGDGVFRRHLPSRFDR